MNGPNQTMTSIWARLEKWAKASTRAEDRRPLSGFPSTQAGGGGGRRRRRRWRRTSRRRRWLASEQAKVQSRPTGTVASEVPPLSNGLSPTLVASSQVKVGSPTSTCPPENGLAKANPRYMNEALAFLSQFFCGDNERMWDSWDVVLWFMIFLFWLEGSFLQNAQICKSLTCHHILFWLLIQRVVRQLIEFYVGFEKR